MTNHTWAIGERCVVIPDQEMPERTCPGVVLTIDQQRWTPELVQCVDDPVWDGYVFRYRGRRYDPKVLPSPK